MAVGVVADPAGLERAITTPVFVGILHGESERRAVFDGEVTSIGPSPNFESGIWVRVASPGIDTIYEVDQGSSLTVGDHIAAGDPLSESADGLYFVRFETPDRVELDGKEVLDQVGCDLSPDQVTAIDVAMLDGSRWRVELSAPILAGIVWQPQGDLMVDGGHRADVTVGNGLPDPERLSPGEPVETVEVYNRTDGLRAETWRFRTGIEYAYWTWIEEPSGDAVVITSGVPHDFAAELVDSLSFEGEGLRIGSERLAIANQRVDIKLYDPSMLFAGADLTISTTCIIAADPPTPCGPPILNVSLPTSSQREALRTATLQPGA